MLQFRDLARFVKARSLCCSDMGNSCQDYFVNSFVVIYRKIQTKMSERRNGLPRPVCQITLNLNLLFVIAEKQTVFVMPSAIDKIWNTCSTFSRVYATLDMKHHYGH